MTVKEMIAELRTDADQFFYSALAVGFENTTVFVTPKDKNALRTLEEAVALGGVPIGFIAARKNGRTLEFVQRALIDEDWAKDYLATLLNAAGCGLESAGLGKMPEGN